MKPTPQINHNQRGLCRDRDRRRSNRKPLLTDYDYRSAAETQIGSSAGPRVTKAPAFHKLSREFLGAETSRDYIAEFAFFILITGIAAWPIMSMLIAVTRLIRNY
jgi:hypothetical protein